MQVLRCSSPEEFLAQTERFRGLDPIRTNLLGSVATSVATGATTFDACWWWVIKENDQVVGASMRTAPFGLQIVTMPEVGATLLAQTVAESDDGFPWLAGPEVLVTTFLETYRLSKSPGSTRSAARGRQSYLYELTSLVTPTVEGSGRVATSDDYDVVSRWTKDFHEYVEGVSSDISERERTMISSRLSARGTFLWCVDDQPVSMASHALAVATPSGSVTRVGPVFTPSDLRGRGYGSAVTALVCGELQRRGSNVMLYADAANPASNSVYQKLGFRFVDDVVQFHLDHPKS